MGVTPFEQQTPDAQIALTEFRTAFLAALVTSQPDETLLKLGDYQQRAPIRARYPLPLGGLGFEEFTGDMPWGEASSASVEIIPRKYAAGVSEAKETIEDPTWLGWNMQPMIMGQQAAEHPMKLLAAAMETPGNSFDGVGFFATNHPVNHLDATKKGPTGAATWSNYGSALTLTAANFKTALGYLDLVPNSLGAPMRLAAKYAVVPSALRGALNEILNGQIVMDDSGTAGVSNINFKAVIPIVNPYLSSSSIWYLLAGEVTVPPFVVFAGPVEMFEKGIGSDYYTDHDRVAFGARRKAAAHMLLPHGVAKFGT